MKGSSETIRNHCLMFFTSQACGRWNTAYTTQSGRYVV